MPVTTLQQARDAMAKAKSANFADREKNFDKLATEGEQCAQTAEKKKDEAVAANKNVSSAAEAAAALDSDENLVDQLKKVEQEKKQARKAADESRAAATKASDAASKAVPPNVKTEAMKAATEAGKAASQSQKASTTTQNTADKGQAADATAGAVKRATSNAAAEAASKSTPAVTPAAVPEAAAAKTAADEAKIKAADARKAATATPLDEAKAKSAADAAAKAAEDAAKAAEDAAAEAEKRFNAAQAAVHSASRNQSTENAIEAKKAIVAGNDALANAKRAKEIDDQIQKDLAGTKQLMDDAAAAKKVLDDAAEAASKEIQQTQDALAARPSQTAQVAEAKRQLEEARRKQQQLGAQKDETEKAIAELERKKAEAQREAERAARDDELAASVKEKLEDARKSPEDPASPECTTAAKPPEVPKAAPPKKSEDAKAKLDAINRQLEEARKRADAVGPQSGAAAREAEEAQRKIESLNKQLEASAPLAEKLPKMQDELRQLEKEAKEAAELLKSLPAPAKFEDAAKRATQANGTAAKHGQQADQAKKEAVDKRIDQLKKEGHGPQRHDNDAAVSEQDLADRAMYKIDPETHSQVDASGNLHEAASTATKIKTKEDYVLAEAACREELDRQLKSGTKPTKPIRVPISDDPKTGAKGAFGSRDPDDVCTGKTDVRATKPEVDTDEGKAREVPLKSSATPPSATTPPPSRSDYDTKAMEREGVNNTVETEFKEGDLELRMAPTGMPGKYSTITMFPNPGANQNPTDPGTANFKARTAAPITPSPATTPFSPVTLEGANGAPVSSVSVAPGSTLPDGLKISGDKIIQDPSKPDKPPGTHDVDVVVTDASGKQTTKKLRLEFT